MIDGNSGLLNINGEMIHVPRMLPGNRSWTNTVAMVRWYRGYRRSVIRSGTFSTEMIDMRGPPITLSSIEKSVRDIEDLYSNKYASIDTFATDGLNVFRRLIEQSKDYK
jgi:hypothetical protein